MREPTNPSQFRFQWSRLSDLSSSEVHAILSARQEVFVVEQRCAYQDADLLDHHAWHLLVWEGSELGAYLRLVDPGFRFAEPSIGRVLTRAPFRRVGLGRRLMAEGLSQAEKLFAQRGIRISAQSYLIPFYESFNFVVSSEPYLEDDIPHVEMVRSKT